MALRLAGSSNQNKPILKLSSSGKPSISFGGSSRQTPEEAAALTQARATAEQTGKMAASAKLLKPRIETLWKYSQQIPRGDEVFLGGLLPERLIEGVKTGFEQWGGVSPRGVAATQMENSAGDILAPLTRFSGDVGNLAEWEQKIRKNLLFSKWDSDQQTQLKKAHLDELAMIADDPRTTKNEIDAFFEKLSGGGNQKFGQSIPTQRKSKYTIIEE